MANVGKVEKEAATAAEVAAVLGLSRVTIRNYRLRGLLPAHLARHGLRDVFLFRIADVVEFAKLHLDQALTADDFQQKESQHGKEDNRQ